MSSPHQRIPYESEERLQDRKQRDQISGILGLDDDKLTNVDVQPLPYMAGAGRVKKFREPQEISQQTSNNGNQSIDIEMVSNPRTDQQYHPRGYPSLANFISSDKDFFVFRRFNNLAARNLLYLQDELIELEEKLNAIDLAESKSGGQQELWNLHSRREDNNLDRRKLMAEMGQKLRAYQDALHSQAQALALEEAPDLVVDSVANWVDGMKPVVEPESHFLDDRQDLVSLSGEHSSKELLENYLERRWYRLFTTKEHKSRPLSNPNVEYYSPSSIKQTARLILALLAVILSVIPLPLLSHFHSAEARLTIITIFTFGFAAILSILTKSRTNEIFAAMAAYAAFLVVFVGSS